MHPEVLAIIWNWIWHLTVAVTDGRRVGHIWPILPFIRLHFIFLATTLALKALKSAQKSAVYILSNILLKWTKDRVRRRQVFVGAVTWSEIWLKGSFERAWFGYLSFMCMSYTLSCDLPWNEMSILSHWWDVCSACYLAWSLSVWYASLGPWREIGVIL